MVHAIQVALHDAVLDAVLDVLLSPERVQVAPKGHKAIAQGNALGGKAR